MEGVARIYKKKPKGSWVTLSLPGSDWLCSYAHIFANVLYYHCRALPAIVLMLHKPAGPLTPSNTTPTSPVSSTEKTSPSRFCHRETSHLEGGRKPPKSPPEGHTTSKHTRSHLIPTQRKYKSTQESTPYKIKNHNPMLRSKRTIIYIYIYIIPSTTTTTVAASWAIPSFQPSSLDLCLCSWKGIQKGFRLHQGKSSMASLHHVWV